MGLALETIVGYVASLTGSTTFDALTANSNQSFTVRIFTPTNTTGADFEPTAVGQQDGCQQIVT